MDKHTIELGDVHFMNQDFIKAEEQYQQVNKGGSMYYIAQVHLAELYLKIQDDGKLDKILTVMERNVENYRKISDADAFRAQNYIGMGLIRKKKFREASKLYKMLTSEVANFYDFRYEGIPLVHDIFRNRAACETELKNYQEALSLLDSTKNWQKICEGSRSPNLLITENLIRSVHESSGSVNELRESEKEIQKIRSSIREVDNIYLSRSAVAVVLDQSVFKIETSQNAK